MMQNTPQLPDDAAFKDMFEDYAAPVEDNGFSNTVLQEIQLREQTAFPWRKTLISFAAFAGGVIAAKQLPALSELSGRAAALTPQTDIISLQTFDVPLYTLAGLSILAAFALWSLFEPLLDV